ncbi:nuclear transport factor 2 family protein [Comamonas testosteroni]|uniref:nuclear transport factor 2 family protein n=1 Tax=Comamonas testosteroni TaxID=285 RepID=UPI00265E6AE5|nr:nuclear transport factor 2 family protein [Comamonas testosteroni]WKL18113.1 nuclear transport factor 2 family protein [Comamonas testosteroni]
MSDTAIAALQQRLELAEARLEIMDLEAEYARAWDAGDAVGWAAVFTEDGVFDLAAVGQGPRLVHTGREELQAFCAQVDAFYKGLHFMHLLRLQIDGDTAQARVHFQWQGMFNASVQYFGQRTVLGYYDVRYQRVQGRWLVKHRLEKAVSGVTTEHYDVYQSGSLAQGQS